MPFGMIVVPPDIFCFHPGMIIYPYRSVCCNNFVLYGIRILRDIRVRRIVICTGCDVVVIDQAHAVSSYTDGFLMEFFIVLVILTNIFMVQF